MAVQRGTGKADRVEEAKMTDEYEFQAMYRGYVDADSIDEAYQRVREVIVDDARLCDLVIHKLDPVERAQKRSTILMCAAADGVERRAHEAESEAQDSNFCSESTTGSGGTDD